METVRLTASANRHWRRLLIFGLAKSRTFKNYPNHRHRILGVCAASGPWVDTGWLFPTLAVAPPLTSSLPPETRRRNRKRGSNHTCFFLTLDPSHPINYAKIIKQTNKRIAWGSTWEGHGWQTSSCWEARAAEAHPNAEGVVMVFIVGGVCFSMWTHRCSCKYKSFINSELKIPTLSCSPFRI